MRNARNVCRCPIMQKLLHKAIPCSYPDTEKCGRKGGSSLCRYRIAEIGLKNCLKEVTELQDFAKHSK